MNNRIEDEQASKRYLVWKAPKLSQHDRMAIQLIIVCVAIITFIIARAFCVVQLQAHSGGPPLAMPSTITFNIRDPVSIHTFLTWVGLERIVEPSELLECRDRKYQPLGIYRRQDGMGGLLCFDPTETVNPAVCSNWGTELVEYTPDTVTCRRAGPGTTKHES